MSTAEVNRAKRASYSLELEPQRTRRTVAALDVVTLGTVGCLFVGGQCTVCNCLSLMTSKEPTNGQTIGIMCSKALVGQLN